LNLEKMNPKAIIFDMDGVLLNSEPIYYEVQMKFFGELGINVSNDEYASFVGLSQTEMWKRIIEKLSSTCYEVRVEPDLRKQTKDQRVESDFWEKPRKIKLEEIIKINNQRNYEHFQKLENLKPTPGLIKFIIDLKNKSVKTAVASSTSKRLVNLILKKLNIKLFFKVIVSGNDIKNGKPAPDIFLKTAEFLKVHPQECLVIEDSLNGVKAAKSAGMICVGFDKFNNGKQDLSEADLIVDDFNKLTLTLS